MGKKPKKEPFNPFKSRARAHSVEPPDQFRSEDEMPGEFRDTRLTFTPPCSKQEAALTIEFRCTTKIVRGDTVMLRLTGFKGVQAGVFTLEKRPHPEEEKEYCTHFHAYWAGESAPKGGPPSSSITLQCRKSVPDNAKVVLGVPDSVHIALPEKLAANSPKLKIEGMVRHATGGGKIPKVPIESCTEIKKKANVEDDISEVEKLLKDLQVFHNLEEEDLKCVGEMSTQEVDQIWERCRDVSDLKLGLTFKTENSIFTGYEEHATLAKTLAENFLESKKPSLALHKELASNLGVKVGAIVALEDALYTNYGCFYFNCELPRPAVMVLRLFTCESHDIARMLGLVNSICINRELMSAIRTLNQPVLLKWTHFITCLSSCCASLSRISHEMIPVLYRGAKDLPAECIQQLRELKKDDWYVFPTFQTYVTEAKYQDDAFSVPDSAVLFEIRDATEGVEIGDISQYPEDAEWLLPIFSSFSVMNVEVLPDKNHLTRVVLRMRGSLAGIITDEFFPSTTRSLSKVAITRSRNAGGGVGSDKSAALDKSSALAKMIKTNVKLHGLRCLHPQHLAHAQYQEKYAEVSRVSLARHHVDECGVRWQQCTQEAVVNPDGSLRPATWEPLPKKPATTLEGYLLRATRKEKQFTGDVPKDGVLLADLKDYQADFGKGPRRVRRLVGKRTVPTHPFSS